MSNKRTHVDVSIKRQNRENLDKFDVLEKCLALDDIKEFECVFGKVISLKAVKDYIRHKSYPSKFLLTIPKTKADYKSISKETIKVPNMQAILVLCVIDKISNDKNIQELMKENTLPYVAYGKPREATVFGNSIKVSDIDLSLSKYTEALDKIGQAIRDGKFNDKETMIKIIQEAKIKPSLPLIPPESSIQDKLKDFIEASIVLD